MAKIKLLFFCILVKMDFKWIYNDSWLKKKFLVLILFCVNKGGKSKGFSSSYSFLALELI